MEPAKFECALNTFSWPASRNASFNRNLHCFLMTLLTLRRGTSLPRFAACAKSTWLGSLASGHEVRWRRCAASRREARKLAQDKFAIANAVLGTPTKEARSPVGAKNALNFQWLTDMVTGLVTFLTVDWLEVNSQRVFTPQGDTTCRALP
jgi:hypothetical protein